MDFEKELQDAIQRGQRIHAAKAEEEQAKTIDEAKLREDHSRFRLELSEHIEKSIKPLVDYFPGFVYESLSGDRGWGGAISRDDARRRGSAFSRLEVGVRPFSRSFVLELTGKGTIGNKEIFNRTHFRRIWEVDQANFTQTVEQWILEFAERFAAHA